MGWTWSTRPRPIHQLGVVLYGRRPPCDKSQRTGCSGSDKGIGFVDHHSDSVEDPDFYPDCIENSNSHTDTHRYKNPHIITNQDIYKNSVTYQNSITDTNSLEHTDGNPD